MINKLRTRNFMTFKRNILKCTNILQLEGMKKFILQYHKDKERDSGELLAIYIQREAELLPSDYPEEEISTKHHLKNCEVK